MAVSNKGYALQLVSDELKKQFGWYFNQKLENSLNFLINLTHFTFGFNFNQKIENSLNSLMNLTSLTFGFNFNQILDNSFNVLINLTHLTFRWVIILHMK